MAALHDVLRYLLARVPARTQAEHDVIEALIDADERGAQPAETKKEGGLSRERA